MCVFVLQLRSAGFAASQAEENIKSLLEHHAKQDQDLEQSFQEKMMEEVNKYQILSRVGLGSEGYIISIYIYIYRDVSEADVFFVSV